MIFLIWIYLDNTKGCFIPSVPLTQTSQAEDFCPAKDLPEQVPKGRRLGMSPQLLRTKTPCFGIFFKVFPTIHVINVVFFGLWKHEWLGVF
jgi:hypothetical protein